MNRRAFVTGLGAVIAAPLGAEAQQAGQLRQPRIGLLTLFSPDHRGARELVAFRQRLRERLRGGPKCRHRLSLSARRHDSLLEFFAEAAGLNVNVILLQGGTPAARLRFTRLAVDLVAVSGYVRAPPDQKRGN